MTCKHIENRNEGKQLWIDIAQTVNSTEEQSEAYQMTKRAAWETATNMMEAVYWSSEYELS